MHLFWISIFFLFQSQNSTWNIIIWFPVLIYLLISVFLKTALFIPSKLSMFIYLCNVFMSCTLCTQTSRAHYVVTYNKHIEKLLPKEYFLSIDLSERHWKHFSLNTECRTASRITHEKLNLFHLEKIILQMQFWNLLLKIIHRKLYDHWFNHDRKYICYF